MADALLAGETTVGVLWGMFGISSLAALMYCFWGTMRITTWKLVGSCDIKVGSSEYLMAKMKDRTAQHMLQNSMKIAFINAVIAAGILAQQFIFERPSDGSYISYLQWIGWSINFAILARMAAVYLAHNYKHEEFVFTSAGLSCLCLLPASFYTGYSYIWYISFLVGFCYTIHILWAYRRRPGYQGFVTLSILTVSWIFGFVFPFGFGHAYSQMMSFEGEMWWYLGGVLLGQLGLSLYMSSTLFNLERKHVRHVMKHFRSRETEIGIPGDESLAVTLVLNQTAVTTTTSSSSSGAYQLEEGGSAGYESDE